MNLRSKLQQAHAPVIFYEIIPPSLEDAAELPDRLKLVAEVAPMADVINIPEIREEVTRGERKGGFRQRMEPRAFARAIQESQAIETVINRVTVHDAAADQMRWLHETTADYGIRDLVLVGGESKTIGYPGPSVPETARMVRSAGLDLLLGGITIPSRPDEDKRLRLKWSAGIEFFTTQVLLEASQTIALLKSLEAVPTRIVLSFTPISHPRDLAFLEWLGVVVPSDVAARFSAETDPRSAARASIELAKTILSEIFEQSSLQTPALGIQVERITKRNSAAAVQMLAELADFYPKLLRETAAAQTVSDTPSTATASPEN